jgi:hypothetical protein
MTLAFLPAHPPGEDGEGEGGGVDSALLREQVPKP